MMRVKFECPVDFINPETWEKMGFEQDNENPECLILNPGTDVFCDNNVCTSE